MTQLRFLLDDAGQSQTQKAVLSAFASDLEARTKGDIVWSSQLPEIRRWKDVPAESSRRLGLRLAALAPAPDLLTVFLPGHIVPGAIDAGSRWGTTLATREFSTVADLDLFAVDNTGSEVRLFHEFVATHPDYEAVSRYASFTSAAPPGWLVSGSLTSALQLTQRPWYYAYAPTRLQWLGWVRRAVERGLLDLSMVEEDVRTGLVRPSLLADVKAIMQGTDAPPLPDLTLDALFMPPERRLTDVQYRLLHSAELQKRTVKYARRNSTGKRAKQGLLKYLWGWFRRLPRRGVQAAYHLYSMMVRPAIKRLRQQSGPRE